MGARILAFMLLAAVPCVIGCSTTCPVDNPEGTYEFHMTRVATIAPAEIDKMAVQLCTDRCSTATVALPASNAQLLFPVGVRFQEAHGAATLDRNADGSAVVVNVTLQLDGGQASDVRLSATDAAGNDVLHSTSTIHWVAVGNGCDAYEKPAETDL